MDFSGSRSSVSIQSALKKAIMEEDDEILHFYRGTGKELHGDDKHPLLQVAYVKVGDEKERRESPFFGWHVLIGFLILLAVAACTFFFIAIRVTRKTAGDQDIQFINRTMWNATKPTERAFLIRPADMVIVSHTDSLICDNNCTEAVHKLQKTQMSVYNYSDIAYNFLIDENGWIYEGRGWGVRPEVVEAFDAVAFAVVFNGDFNFSPPSEPQAKAFKALLTMALIQGSIDKSYNIVGLRQLRITDSTGDELYVWLRSLPHWKRCYMATCM